MKTLLALLIMQTLFTFNLFAQWQPDIRLTNNPASSYTSYNAAACIASKGDSVHVAWFDDRDGNFEIYYKRSTDGGTVWGPDIRLTNNSATSWACAISVSGSGVHVAWYDERDGNQEIYYKGSTDGGINWSSETRLTYNSASSIYPSVAVSGQIVNVVWYDLRNFNEEIYYKRSTNGGVSWGPDSRLTIQPDIGSYTPSVSASGQALHVVWQASGEFNPEIFHMSSSDGGIKWGTITRLTNDSADSYYPSVSVSGAAVHVVWMDERDGNAEIFYKLSSDSGKSWGTDTRLTNNAAVSDNPSVSASGQAVHIVWWDARDGNTEIYYKRSTNGGASWSADMRLTNNLDGSGRPTVSVSGSKVHIVWYDLRDGNPEIYYKRDPTGNPIGIINISSKVPEKFSLSQNYPNPFNPVTNLEFGISDLGFVSLKVYDILGNEIETLVNENLSAGSYSVEWDAANYPSGTYFYRITTENFTDVKRMMLVK